MEFSTNEAVAVEQVTLVAKVDQLQELNSLQLLLVGGGVGEVLLG